jgi:hypothetical protein
MITKEQCKQLNIGDYLFFFNKWRRINNISQHPRGNIIYFRFTKLRGKGMCLYTNHDLKNKVIAALKNKSHA